MPCIVVSKHRVSSNNMWCIKTLLNLSTFSPFTSTSDRGIYDFIYYWIPYILECLRVVSIVYKQVDYIIFLLIEEQWRNEQGRTWNCDD